MLNASDDNELSALVNGVHGAGRYKAIVEYILNAIEDKSIVFNDGLEAIVDKRDASHIAHGAGKHKVNQIAKIKDLINQALNYAEENNVNHNKFNQFLYYESIVKYDGEIFPLYLNLGRGKNDGKYHLYDITKKIRDTANRTNGLERPKPNEGYAQENDISNSSIPQDSDSVKREFSDAEIKYSDRDPDSVSNRSLLANALETVAQNDKTATRKEYKNAIDTDTKTADLWSKQIPDIGRGPGGDLSVLGGRRRSASNDTLSEDSSERYTARYTERERQTFGTKEEIDEVVKQLREMYGLDSKKYSDRDSNGNDIRYSDRDPDSVSNRSLLANALETVAQNDIERNKHKQYGIIPRGCMKSSSRRCTFGDALRLWRFHAR